MSVVSKETKHNIFLICKFIVIVEDNSNSIIINEGIGLYDLDIQEFEEEILSHNKIYGVIMFDTSTRGNSVIAKDRAQLEADRDGRKLRTVLSCDIHMLMKEIDIEGISL